MRVVDCKMKLKDPNTLATEIWDCIIDCHLTKLVVADDKATLPQEEHAAVIDYITDLITGDRELILRRFLNGGGE